MISTSRFRSLKKSLAVVATLLLANQLFAAIPDSLAKDYQLFKKTVESDLDNITMADSLWQSWTWKWTDVDQEEFDDIINLLEQRIKATDKLEQQAAIHNLLQDIYQRRNLLGKAVVQYEKMIAIHTVMEDTIQVVRDYHWLAWMYHKNKLHEESLIVYDKVRNLQEKLPMTEELANFVWTHGYFYSVAGWDLKKPEYQDSAVKYLGQSFVNCKEVLGEVHLEWSITYAMALARQGNKRKAISIANYGLATANRLNEILYLGRFNKQLSQYYLSLEMEDSAFFHIYEAAKYDDIMYAKDDPNVIRLENGRGRLHMFNLGFLIEIQNQFGQIDKSSKLLDRVLYGPERLQDYGAIVYYHRLGASTYFLNKEYKKSAESYAIYSNYQDSLHRANLDKSREVKTAQLESQIALEQEKAEIEKEQREVLAQREKENLRTVIWAILGVSILTAIFLIFVYRRFKITSRQKNLIEEQKGLVESAYTQLGKKNREILDSINYAKRIQNAILPPKSIVEKLLPQSFILYMPKDIIAGDFYWLEKRDDIILFAAADCTGHGVPGAMVSVVCNNGLNRSVREHGILDPGKILDKTREIVISEFEKSEEEVNDGMDIALCTLKKNSSEGNYELKYAGAHNPLWVIRKGSDEIEEYAADKQPIGTYFHTTPYKTHSLTVNSGDLIYVFSDGYQDQFGGDRGKKYYIGRFQELLLKIKDQNIEKQKEALQAEHLKWKGSRDQLDDICVIGLKVE